MNDTTTKTLDVEALCARLDRIGSTLLEATTESENRAGADVVEARELLTAWADALGWIASHDAVNVEAAKRKQRVAAGARWQGRRPAEVLR